MKHSQNHGSQRWVVVAARSKPLTNACCARTRPEPCKVAPVVKDVGDDVVRHRRPPADLADVREASFEHVAHDVHAPAAGAYLDGDDTKRFAVPIDRITPDSAPSTSREK